MVALINESIGATSLHYISLDNMVKAIIEAPDNMMLKADNLCTYCWTGKKPVLLSTGGHRTPVDTGTPVQHQ